ncbi:MAG: hypothetical protein WCT35_04885 [Sideroxydans sp.]|jgi:hypothetical protein
MTDKFKVTAVSARLHAGVLVLTKEQARPRRHNLKEVGKGRYEIVNPVEFKLGEEFGYEGELPKALALNLTSAADAEKAAKKAAEAEAKAKAKAEADAKKLRDKLETDALTAWEGSADLREQHGNDFEAYLAIVVAG